MDAHQRKQPQSLERAEPRRMATDEQEAKRLGDELGRIGSGG